MLIEVTNEDIEYAERLLLPPGSHFNEERRAFMRCMESRDVVACPGSGKTTALLAKLLILARKVPSADGRGICVLTHTNVAVDLIRAKAGIASTYLFRYPNFFGTIHSFLGTYLAIPAFVEMFGHRQIRIDDDYYRIQATREFFKGNIEANGAIYGQLKQRLRGLSWKEQREMKRDFFVDLAFRFEDGFVSYCRSDNGQVVVKGSRTPSESYGPIHDAKYGLLRRGCLRYQDIFPLAHYHLNNHSQIVDFLQCRFAYVFVDEMQDSNEEQVAMLDTIFPQHPDQISQRIGDPNQAIYHDLEDVHSGACWSPRDPIHFSDSRRYGGMVDSVVLQPCTSVSSFQPHLITFEEDEVLSVIPAFALLIAQLSDGRPPVGPCKAIGWIGRDRRADGRLCIPSYFPQYDSAPRVQNRRFTNFVSYTAHAIRSARSEGVKRFLDIAMQGIPHALDVAGIKDEMTELSYTTSTAERFLRSQHEHSYDLLRTQIAALYLSALNSELTPIDLRNRIIEVMKLVWPSVSKAGSFLVSDQIDETVETNVGNAQSRNRFVAENGLVIDVGTAHSVKGETHFATLYLETRYQKDCDASRLIEFLKGNRPAKQIEKAHHQQNLKIAHVAFSRPTHLLAFACQRSSIMGHEDGLRANGWVIRSVSEFYPMNQEPEP